MIAMPSFQTQFFKKSRNYMVNLRCSILVTVMAFQKILSQIVKQYLMFVTARILTVLHINLYSRHHDLPTLVFCVW